MILCLVFEDVVLVDGNVFWFCMVDEVGVV